MANLVLEKQKNMRRTKKTDSRSKVLYLMASIPMLLLFVFNYLPMFGVIIAFKNYKYDQGILGSAWVGFKNLEYFFQSSSFWRIITNTLWYNAIFIVTGIVAAVIIALLLYELTSRRATKLFQTVMITPHFISWVVAGYMAYAILQPQNGYLNNLLIAFGMKPADWYTTPKAWTTILATANMWKNVGLDSVMYYAALMGIDDSYFEAAKIDGAGRFRRTWHISIPSIIPLMSMLTILKIGNIFVSDFGLFYQITRDVGTLYNATDVINTYAFRAMRVIGDFGTSSAIGLFQSVLGFILVIVTNHFSKKINPDNALL